MPLRAQRFGAVSLLNVLDRTDDPRGLLAAASSRLLPGGLLLVATVLPFCDKVSDKLKITALPFGDKLHDKLRITALPFCDKVSDKLKITALPFCDKVYDKLRITALPFCDKVYDLASRNHTYLPVTA